MADPASGDIVFSGDIAGEPGPPMSWAQPPAHVPLAFVENLAAPELSDEDLHHLSRVLRLRAGDQLVVSDGVGRWRLCRFGERLEPVADVAEVAPPEPLLTVGFALVKGAKPELVVQKLTELGIDRIVPFVADRSVVRWDAERADHQARRLTKVAREASMQARRARLPVVEPLADFHELIGVGPVAGAERHGSSPDLAWPTVLVGPEGGWSPEERSRLGHEVGLGELVLRAETAAIVAGAMLAGLRSGLVRGGSSGGGQGG